MSDSWKDGHQAGSIILSVLVRRCMPGGLFRQLARLQVERHIDRDGGRIVLVLEQQRILRFDEIYAVADDHPGRWIVEPGHDGFQGCAAAAYLGDADLAAIGAGLAESIALENRHPAGCIDAYRIGVLQDPRHVDAADRTGVAVLVHIDFQHIRHGRQQAHIQLPIAVERNAVEEHAIAAGAHSRVFLPYAQGHGAGQQAQYARMEGVGDIQRAMAVLRQVVAITLVGHEVAGARRAAGEVVAFQRAGRGGHAGVAPVAGTDPQQVMGGVDQYALAVGKAVGTGRHQDFRRRPVRSHARHRALAPAAYVKRAVRSGRDAFRIPVCRQSQGRRRCFAGEDGTLAKQQGGQQCCGMQKGSRLHLFSPVQGRDKPFSLRRHI
ncbi:hypothetical protein CFU_0246 [Collimonas fungivorans Ter331]|uniref:Uncharacterized protein n=1 Tax=Collimonas fungivorans (strain Ter331) TaxID=1005048 RepID=G0AHP5_COLFT|nr:hypothetical protein CFU_0246 [Collimonas fungivorans Ter331]